MAGVREKLGELLNGKEKRDPGGTLPEATDRRRGPETFAEDNNDFALALYGQLRQKSGNLFFSPFSIRTALGMTFAGARGETAAEMGEALRLPTSEETYHAAVATMMGRLNAASPGRHEMTIASSLWGQDGAPLRADFMDLVARHYAGRLNRVDFGGAAEAARAAINHWVEDKTRQKIQELIPPGGTGADTRLVVVNAVYFKGMWELQFPKRATREEAFHMDGGGMVRPPMMHQQVGVRYMQTEGYQAVELDYRGGGLSMLVLLPVKEDGLRDLEEALSARMLRHCEAQMIRREVKLFLPRFRVTWGTAEIGDPLRALGMRLAFTRQADFSGINGYEPPHEESLFINAVFHKAFVDVNEEGTEAAASSAVMVVPTMSAVPSKPPPVPVFRADHPFLFAIRDQRSDAILFLGRVAEPTQES